MSKCHIAGNHMPWLIYKDKYVISSIPTSFENKELPIVRYKYNKPIRSLFIYLFIYTLFGEGSTIS